MVTSSWFYVRVCFCRCTHLVNKCEKMLNSAILLIQTYREILLYTDYYHYYLKEWPHKITMADGKLSFRNIGIWLMEMESSVATSEAQQLPNK